MQSIQIGAVEFETKQPAILRDLKQLEQSGVNIKSAAELFRISDKLAVQANQTFKSVRTKAGREQAEALAHKSQRIRQAAIAIKKVPAPLLNTKPSVIIDTGAVKKQPVEEAPALTVEIPPAEDLPTTGGPGAGPGEVIVPAGGGGAPLLGDGDKIGKQGVTVSTEISNTTILMGLGLIGAAVWWMRRKKA